MGSNFVPYYYINVVKQTNKTFSGAVVFFHGTGDSGRGIRDWIKSVSGRDLMFPHLMINYPTAPSRPFTAMGGDTTSIWFDRPKLDINTPDNQASLDESCEHMAEFISEQVAVGISVERIILGGFSMGGCFSMHLGLRYLPNVAGVFTLSSFLSQNSLVYKMKSAPKMPVFMCHGDKDELVPLKWGQSTYDNLKKLGVNAEFHVLKNTYHEIIESEIKQLKDWIIKVLPPK